MPELAANADIFATPGRNPTSQGTMSHASQTREEMRGELEALRSRVAELEATGLALREAKQRYDLVVETSDSVIICLDSDHRVLSWNRAAEKLYGLPRKAVLGKDYLELFVPERFRAAVAEDLKNVLAGAPIREFENSVRSKDGVKRYLLWNVECLLDANKEPQGIVAIGHDISERKRLERELAKRRDELERSAEERTSHLLEANRRLEQELERRARAEAALRESEEKYRLLVSHIPNVAWVSDRTGRTIFISPNVEEIYGYTEEEIYEAGDEIWFGRIHPDDVQQVRKAYEALFADDQGFDIEYRIQHKDGHWIWLRDRALSSYEEGRERYAYGVFCDITERKQAAELLRESEEKYRVLFEAAANAIFLGQVLPGKQPLFVDFNSRTLEIFGCSRKDLIGKGPEDFSPPEQPDGTPSRVRILELVKAAAEGRRQLFEWQHCRLDGTPFDAEVSLNCLNIGDQKYLLATVRDTTERKRAEKTLARYRDQLEELVEGRTRELEQSREKLRLSERLATVGTLAAGIAHQINNPLGAILNAAQYALLCEGDANERAAWKRSLTDTVEQAKRCGRIVHSILQFARHEPTEKWSGDANEALQRACQITATYALERRAEIALQSSRAPAPVWMNPIEMEQVLVNVIRNAIESRAEGARIEVQLKQEPDVVCIEVRDNGRGIEAETLKHIFDPFYTTRLTQGGSGLGLSVAHGIVADHGGRIAVESEPGAGTTVFIELPLCRES